MVDISEILSLGAILLLGFFISFVLNKIHIPGIVGVILLGIAIGPEFLGIITKGILNLSSELRTLALIIILTQCGFHLDLESLKRVGRPAILLSILPAIFETVGGMVGSLYFLNFTYAEGLALGAVLGSVSPAIIAVRMIKLISGGYGEKHSVPKLILAGASIDDIFTIVLFYSFLNIIGTESAKFDWMSLLGIPISIVSGVILGFMGGYFVLFLFKKIKFHKSIKTLIIFGICCSMYGLEAFVEEKKKGTSWEFVSVSGLLGVIINGIVILYRSPETAKELSTSYSSIWDFFEIILFILVGASLKFNEEFKSNLINGILVLVVGLVFRTVGGYISMIGTGLNWKEQLYIVVTYISKATVQASIGGVAESRGLACGEKILDVSIISILITAPLGSLWMEIMGPILLEKDGNTQEEKGREFYDKNNEDYIQSGGITSSARETVPPVVENERPTSNDKSQQEVELKTTML